MPLWLLDAPSVGELRSPKADVMRPDDGQGQVKLISPAVNGVNVSPFASAFFLASSSCALILASMAAMLFSSACMAFCACHIGLHAAELRLTGRNLGIIGI